MEKNAEKTAVHKTLLSGVKPTGRPHIGNYFGAMRQFVELQKDHRTFVMIADYHALTSVHNAKELQADILGVALDYLAIGLDPAHVTIFKQSDVPAHTELAWIFNCITTMPYLARAHAFKDAETKDKEVNVGLFTYPLLMAADILLYDADVVPVGADQQQHLEIARDVGRKFNLTFGGSAENAGDSASGIFKEPKALILKDVGIVPGTDGRKMSKSYNNTIPLFADDETIKKAVMSIVTDSKGVNDAKDPEKDLVFAMHKLFSSPAELSALAERYTKGDIGYRESKELLIKSISAFIAPLREKRAKLETNIDAVKDILQVGGEKAREMANAKMEVVRKAIGVTA
jgi:tryptophanyl-tRNA synthetase